jgi:hypothetical protein
MEDVKGAFRRGGSISLIIVNYGPVCLYLQDKLALWPSKLAMGP